MAQRGKLSDSEREKLAQKLDEDLDAFMDTLAANRDPNQSKKPFDFDEWSKKIDQHPFFMNELKPNENGVYSDAVEALLALKNEDDDTPEEIVERAESAKNEGNKLFRLKKYKWAIEAYTNGIASRCPDAKLNAILYANRAATHRHLGNLRSAFRDCFVARKFDSHHFKAILRGGECLLELNRSRECLEWLDGSVREIRSTSVETMNVDQVECEKNLRAVDELRKRALQAVQLAERDARLERRKREQRLKSIRRLIEEIRKRRLNLPGLSNLTKNSNGDEDEDECEEWYQSVQIEIPQANSANVVRYDADADELVWPVLLQYPQAGRTDLLNDCAESTPIRQLTADVFASSADWDETHQFRAENVQFFVPLISSDSANDDVLLRVDPADCLRKFLSSPGVEIRRGLPIIQVYTHDHVTGNMNAIGEGRFRLR